MSLNFLYYFVPNFTRTIPGNTVACFDIDYLMRRFVHSAQLRLAIICSFVSTLSRSWSPVQALGQSASGSKSRGCRFPTPRSASPTPSPSPALSDLPLYSAEPWPMTTVRRPSEGQHDDWFVSVIWKSPNEFVVFRFHKWVQSPVTMKCFFLGCFLFSFLLLFCMHSLYVWWWLLDDLFRERKKTEESW